MNWLETGFRAVFELKLPQNCHKVGCPGSTILSDESFSCKEIESPKSNLVLCSYQSNAMVKTKRLYELVEESDDDRILVSRYWPRGVSKDRLSVTDWLRNLAPSKEGPSVLSYFKYFSLNCSTAIPACYARRSCSFSENSGLSLQNYVEAI